MPGFRVGLIRRFAKDIVRLMVFCSQVALSPCACLHQAHRRASARRAPCTLPVAECFRLGGGRPARAIGDLERPRPSVTGGASIYRPTRENAFFCALLCAPTNSRTSVIFHQ